MQKNLKLIIATFLLLSSFSLLNNKSFAYTGTVKELKKEIKENKIPLTDANFLFIHGVLTQNGNNYFTDRKNLENDIKKHGFGTYKMAEMSKDTGFWGHYYLTRVKANEKSSNAEVPVASLKTHAEITEIKKGDFNANLPEIAKDFQYEALDGVNGINKAYEYKKPVIRWLNVFDLNTSTQNQVCDIRRFGHNFFFDVFQYLGSPELRSYIFNSLDQGIDNAYNLNHKKVILMGHSYGGIILTDYMISKYNTAYPSKYDKIQPTARERQLAKEKLDKIQGLITFGTQTTTVLSVKLATEINKKRWNEPNFIDNFVNDGKFWINAQHRNDPTAINLPAEFETNKVAGGKGFITSQVLKSNGLIALKNLLLPSVINEWFTADTPIKAHSWYLIKHEKFIKKVNDIYLAEIAR